MVILEVLKSGEWLVFSFFAILFSRMGLPKLSSAMGGLFFEGLNFMNEEHPQNSQNLHTSKKPTLWYNTVKSMKISIPQKVTTIWYCIRGTLGSDFNLVNLASITKLNVCQHY